MDDVHRFDRNTQTGGDHLGKRRLMALAVAVRAGEHGHAAGGVHAHFAAFEQARTRTQGAGDIAGRQAAGLDVAGVANAAQQALGGTGGFALLKPGGVAQALGGCQAAQVVARVVLQRHRRLVRPGIDEVALADFVLRQAQFPAATRHQSLNQVSGLRSASAAVGVHRRGVGEPGVHFHVDQRAGVLARQERGVQNRGHGRGEGRQIGAQIGVGVHPHGQEFAVLVHRHFGVADVVAAVRVGQERLGTLAGPFDAAVDLLGSPGQRHIFGVEVNLGAKTATHVGGDHTHFVLGQAQHKGRHQQALDVRVLVRHVQHVLFGGAAVAANGGARLHGVGHQAVVDEVELGDMGRATESGVHQVFVAQRPFVAMVVGGGVVQLGTSGCVSHVHHSAQGFVIDHHGFGGVFGLLYRLGNHHGYLVTHVAGFTQGQHRVGRLVHGFAVGAGDQPAAGQSAHLAL